MSTENRLGDMDFANQIKAIATTDNPYDRINAAWILRDNVNLMVRELVRDTITELVNDRYSQTEIAHRLGITKQRVGQILNGE